MSNSNSNSNETIEVMYYKGRKMHVKGWKGYATLFDLWALLRNGHSVRVTDKDTGDDITDYVLAQIVAHVGTDNRPALLAAIRNDEGSFSC